MSLGRWILARLGGAVLASWGIASALFLLVHLLPIPVDEFILGDATDLSRVTDPGTVASQRPALLALRHRLGLDKPIFYFSRTSGSPVRWHWHGLHNQYHQWLRELLHGELGYSYRNGQSVNNLLASPLLCTLPLMAAAAGLATVGAVWLALGLAHTPTGQEGWRLIIRSGLMGMQAMPLFALALGLLLLFANPDLLNILPVSELDIDHLALTNISRLAAYGGRLVLPLLSLVFSALPELTLLLETTLRQQLAAEYANTARAKGLTSWQLAYRHALPNALLPLFTLFTGLLPSLVAGAVVVEVLFALPGTGRLFAEAAAAHDYPVVIAGVLLTAAVRLLALLLADVLYFWADPRLRTAA